MSEVLGVLATPATTHGQALRHALVVVLAMAVGLSFGLVYGQGNHNTYLLYGLRQLNPEFLQHDWLAASTTHYHQSFALVMRALSWLGPLPWSIALTNVSLIAGVLVATYGFLVRHFGSPAFSAICLLMFIVVLDGTYSVGSSHILTFILEPSSVAAAAVFGALLLFLQGRYFWSGLLLAIGGFFHTNFLLLDFVFFGLAQLVLGRAGLIRRAMMQLGPSLLVLIHEAPLLFALATDPLATEAREIFLFIRSPHHYVPLSYLHEFVPFFGWHLLALSAAARLDKTRPVHRALLLTYALFLGLVLLATLLTTVVFIPFISQLFFWRMAPFSILLGQLIIVVVIAQYLNAGQWPRTAHFGDGGRILALGGVGLLLAHYFRGPSVSDTDAKIVVAALTVIGALVLLSVAEQRIWLKVRSRIAPAMAPLLMLCVALALSAQHAYEVSNVLHGFSAPKRELFAWVRTTAPDARFLTPPSLKAFRLHAERAVVVDWKSIPLVPSELLEWYRRIGRVSGNPAVKSEAGADLGYATMDQARIDSLVKEFGVRYAVFKQPVDTSRITKRVAFANKKYIVFELR